jgi:hypothetical protein
MGQRQCFYSVLLVAKPIEISKIGQTMNFKRDLDKETLYNGVKTLVEQNDSHLHLPQQKLFTLFSLAFQYMLFRSGKNPGHYIIRIEDSFLADKLCKKSKDQTTRSFMQKLLIPRRLAYSQSMFHLDYFNLTSWGITKDLPKEKIQGAIIVKNTSHNPLIEETDFRQMSLSEDPATVQLFGAHYYLTSLTEFVPKTITIAFEEKYDHLVPLNFDFINDHDSTPTSGVKLARGLEFEED